MSRKRHIFTTEKLQNINYLTSFFSRNCITFVNFAAKELTEEKTGDPCEPPANKKRLFDFHKPKPCF